MKKIRDAKRVIWWSGNVENCVRRWLVSTGKIFEGSGVEPRKGYVSRTIGIKLRYQDFKIATRDMTLPFATADATVIRAAAGECLRRIPLDSKFRLLGVRATTLSPKPDVQEAPQNRPVQLMLL